jgi:glycosyltransferase involved in cell wall biosynthesis
MADRVVVIPNFAPDPSTASASNQRNRQILYVGRIHPEKGIHLLIEAFLQLRTAGDKRARLCIVGPWEAKHGGGGPEYRNQLLSQSKGAAGFIEWVGPVYEPAKLNSYYKESALFAYPSLAEKGETFGLAPLEAMSQGCPVVVSALNCFSDFVTHGHNGWVFDHRGKDPAAELAAALSAAINNWDSLRSASENAIRTARGYSLSAVSKMYLDDFKTLV